MYVSCLADDRGGCRGGVVIMSPFAKGGVARGEDVALTYDVLVDQSNCDASGYRFKKGCHLYSCLR